MTFLCIIVDVYRRLAWVCWSANSQNGQLHRSMQICSQLTSAWLSDCNKCTMSTSVITTATHTMSILNFSAVIKRMERTSSTGVLHTAQNWCPRTYTADWVRVPPNSKYLLLLICLFMCLLNEGWSQIQPRRTTHIQLKLRDNNNHSTTFTQ